MTSRFFNPGVLLSERSLLFHFTCLWAVVVLLPLLGATLFSFLSGYGLRWNWEFTLRAYENIYLSGRWQVIERTMLMATVVTLICLLVAFPFSLWLAKGVKSLRLKQLIWIALTVPFFLDPSARTLVWRSVLGSNGPVNQLLMGLGVIDSPLQVLLYTDFAVGFGLIAPYFPNMVWPIYLAIILIDDSLITAARDLGASHWQLLRDIILPLALPGIAAGVVFTFVPILGDNVITQLLGGGMKEYLANSISSLVTSMNYAGAAAFSTLILLVALILGQSFWWLNRIGSVRD